LRKAPHGSAHFCQVWTDFLLHGHSLLSCLSPGYDDALPRLQRVPG
jgi:hypothetical protein